MPKFFVISDVHGFYDEMIKALNDSGFDKNNPDHWLISCGDNWDRGEQPVEVLHYLNFLQRKILVRGNHEDLLADCCNRMYPMEHDFSNGTVGTIFKLGSAGCFDSFEEQSIKTLARVDFFLNQQVNYFETQNYIFVHGFIPVICNDNFPIYYRTHKDYSYNPNWRNASEKAWKAARWLNGVDMVNKGLIPDKTVVCGHWHCSYGHSLEDGTSEYGEDANFEPYYGNKIIAIDACTAHTHKVNVLILNDEFIVDK